MWVWQNVALHRIGGGQREKKKIICLGTKTKGRGPRKAPVIRGFVLEPLDLSSHSHYYGNDYCLWGSFGAHWLCFWCMLGIVTSGCFHSIWSPFCFLNPAPCPCLCLSTSKNNHFLFIPNKNKAWKKVQKSNGSFPSHHYLFVIIFLAKWTWEAQNIGLWHTQHNFLVLVRLCWDGIQYYLYSYWN